MQAMSPAPIDRPVVATSLSRLLAHSEEAIDIAPSPVLKGIGETSGGGCLQPGEPFRCIQRDVGAGGVLQDSLSDQGDIFSHGDFSRRQKTYPTCFCSGSMAAMSCWLRRAASSMRKLLISLPNSIMML